VKWGQHIWIAVYLESATRLKDLRAHNPYTARKMGLKIEELLK